MRSGSCHIIKVHIPLLSHITMVTEYEEGAGTRVYQPAKSTSAENNVQQLAIFLVKRQIVKGCFTDNGHCWI